MIFMRTGLSKASELCKLSLAINLKLIIKLLTDLFKLRIIADVAK